MKVIFKFKITKKIQIKVIELVFKLQNSFWNFINKFVLLSLVQDEKQELILVFPFVKKLQRSRNVFDRIFFQDRTNFDSGRGILGGPRSIIMSPDKR